MNFRTQHQTRYRYETSVSRCYNEARLTPAIGRGQHCLESDIQVDPQPSELVRRVDFFGNTVCYFSIDVPHDTLTVTASSRVRVDPHESRAHESTGPSWEVTSQQTQAGLSSDYLEARQYVLDSPVVRSDPSLKAYAGTSFTPQRPVLSAVTELMARVHEEFVYDPGFTTVATPLATVLAHRRGVCQDFAHLAIGCLRSVGLAACYVSGYIETEAAPGESRMVGADASHAWFSVFVPERGWVDFDPTNNQMPWDRHITIARGRDYSDVPPLKGVLVGGGHHDLSVSVSVLREEV